MTTPSYALGRYLPAEILNTVFELVMEDDNIAYVSPWPTAAITSSGSLKRNGATMSFAITSTNPLMRTCKDSRNTYHSLFRAKTLKMNAASILAIVRDLNFDYLLEYLVGRVFKRSNEVQAYFREREFTVQLVFTQDFLRNPDYKTLKHYIDRLEKKGQTDTRPYSFHYYTSLIPTEHCEKVRNLFRDFVFLRRGVPSPELSKIMDDLKESFEDNPPT